MIYFCADDYGLCEEVSARIQQCIEEGALNKVSVFPNFEKVELRKIAENKNVRISLHLNLVEGKCMADANAVGLLAQADGSFKHRFGGLFALGLLRGKKLEMQLYREIKAQVLYWKSILPAGIDFCIDSHQHTHMIPAVFKALMRVLHDEEIQLQYIRIPTEPIHLYIKTPSLYHTYSLTNVIKQWLLNFLWLWDKKHIKAYKIPTAHFCGILFSGKMDAKRVSKILPKYIKSAQKDGRDIEVLFHPGYIEKSKPDFKNQNIVFEKFYLSKNRKTEFDSVRTTEERSVRNAVH
ncbi:MAG: ChbG/HpnK family deacetylase [Clostridia bacterium]|nr:ChbG/HpnK family deacetylase [Clostridia bacterium]